MRVGVTRPEPRRDPEPAARRSRSTPREIGLRRSTASTRAMGYESAHGLIEVVDDNNDVDRRASTSSPARPGCSPAPSTARSFDLLFIDEAGQFSLANAAAARPRRRRAWSCSATRSSFRRSPRPTTPTAPAPRCSSTCSTARATIPPDRGVLLTETWRMHPDVCAFVSERSYDESAALARGVRDSARRRARRRLTGAGLRAARRRARGPQPGQPGGGRGDRRGRAATLLAGATVTDADGQDRGRSRPSDIMVVAPYNLAVRLHPRAGARRVSASAPSTSSKASRRRRVLRDDLLVGRGRAPRARLPLRPQPLQRGGLPGAVPRRAGAQPARCSTPTARRWRRWSSWTARAASSRCRSRSPPRSARRFGPAPRSRSHDLSSGPATVGDLGFVRQSQESVRKAANPHGVRRGR